MAYFANQRFVLDQNTKDLEEARAWLASRDFPAYEATPEMIARFEGMGCKAIDWHGIKVGLICFRNDSDHIVHLVVGSEPKVSLQGLL